MFTREGRRKANSAFGLRWDLSIVNIHRFLDGYLDGPAGTSGWRNTEWHVGVVYTMIVQLVTNPKHERKHFFTSKKPLLDDPESRKIANARPAVPFFFAIGCAIAQPCVVVSPDPWPRFLNHSSI